MGLVFKTWLLFEPILTEPAVQPQKKIVKENTQRFRMVKKYVFKYGSPVKIPKFWQLLATEKNKKDS